MKQIHDPVSFAVLYNGMVKPVAKTLCLGKLGVRRAHWSEGASELRNAPPPNRGAGKGETIP
jgi:hypothetical protein